MWCLSTADSVLFLSLSLSPISDEQDHLVSPFKLSIQLAASILSVLTLELSSFYFTESHGWRWCCRHRNCQVRSARGKYKICEARVCLQGFALSFLIVSLVPTGIRLSFSIVFDLPKAWNSSEGFTESKIKQAKIPKAADGPSVSKKRKVTPSEASNNAASRGPWAPPSRSSRSAANSNLQSTGSSRGAEGARRELADLLA